MNETGSGIRDWLRKQEGDMHRLEDKFDKFADEIKNTIRFEVAVLKTETIADLRRRVDDGYRTLEKFDERVRENENAIRDIKTRRSLLDWFITTVIAGATAIAGYLGAKH